MKTFLLMMILVSSSTAFADCNREAQFVGNVKNLKTKSTSFSFQLSLGRWFSPSIVCPMDEEEFISAIVEIGYVSSAVLKKYFMYVALREKCENISIIIRL